MSHVTLPSMVAMPKIGVIETSRWWTSAIRRHFHSWQIQVSEYRDHKLLTADELKSQQLWIIDLNLPDKESAELISLFYAEQKLSECLLILPESRASLICKFLEIGVGRVVINPSQETELIQWIQLRTMIPQIRVI